MATLTLTQTDTVAKCGIMLACTSPPDGLATTPHAKEATSGGSAGSSELSVTINKADTQAGVMFESADGEPNKTTWESGTWTVRLNVTTSVSDLTLEEVHVCRINDACTSQETVGSAVEQAISMGSTGVKTVNVTGAEQNASASDRIYIVLIFTIPGAVHANKTFGFTPDQDIDTPIVSVSYKTLSGSAGGISSVSVSPVKVKKEISGDVSSTTTVDAILSALMEFVSSAEGTSGATASLIKLRKLIGSAGSTSTADAILQVFAVVNLIGSADSTSGATALLKSLKKFIGSAGETSGATANLKSLKEFVTSAGGVSDATGDLKALKELIGSVSSTSGATGLLKPDRGISASVDSASSALAILTKIEGGGIQSLSGDAQGTSSVAGILSALMELVGSASGNSGATANSKILKELIGSAGSSSGLTGVLKKLKGLSSSATGTSSATGNAKQLRRLTTVISGLSMITGDTSILKSLISSVDATSGVTGNLTVELVSVTPKLITGVMSESLHIKGIMSKEFSAIRCLDFNGSTDYVNCGKDSSLDMGLGDFTIEAWAKFQLGISNNYGDIVGKGGWNDVKSYGILNHTGDSIVGYLCKDRWLDRKTTPHYFYDSNWHDYIVTFDRSGYMVLSVDGKPHSSIDITSYNDIDFTNSADVFIGKYPSWNMEGKICITRKWNRVLSPEERKNCFNGNAPRNGLVAEWLMREQQGNIIHDTSINSNHGTIYGADWHEEKFNTPLKGIMSNSSEIKGIMTAEYI